ncbi:MAG: hypothetical protein H6618_08070 [Deltaproteobacteria bacterium]|nr:hypothetical protein [Deltaproteobacteria bacterium]
MPDFKIQASRAQGHLFDEVCTMAGLSESKLWSWMRGKSRPEVSTIRKINQFFKGAVKSEENC